MIKKITLNKDQSMELSGSVGWLMIYKERFGRDILPDIMPVLESGLTASVKMLQNGAGADNFIDSIDDEILTNMFITLSGFEMTTALQIIWAMAKKADDDIPGPEDYYDQFEVFPLDKVLPVAINLIITSMVSSKNAKSLLTMVKSLRTSHSTKSSSQASTEV